jgi:hypothetical protein
MGSAKSRELAARRQTSVDDSVVAKASKTPTDQQISIQAWAQWVGSLVWPKPLGLLNFDTPPRRFRLFLCINLWLHDPQRTKAFSQKPLSSELPTIHLEWKGIG